MGNETVDPVALNADLSLAKTTTPDPVTAGATATSQLTVTNSGPSPATNVVVTDTLTPGVTAATATITGGTCAIAGQVVTCTVPTLADQAQATATITAPVPAAATVTTFGNSASVDSATLDPDPANNSASASVDVVRRADVGVTKALAPGTPANPPPGSTVNYVVTVRNNGPSSADGVLLTDVVDPRLTGSTPGCTSSGATLSCPLGTIAPQQELTFTVPAVIDATLPAGTVIPNTVAVSSLTPDPVDTNQESTATFTTGAPQADLETVKSGPATVVAGQAATYTLSVVNHGPSDASTVTVTDTLPLGATVVSAASTRGSCAPAGDVRSGPAARRRHGDDHGRRRVRRRHGDRPGDERGDGIVGVDGRSEPRQRHRRDDRQRDRERRRLVGQDRRPGDGRARRSDRVPHQRRATPAPPRRGP